jgi:Tol biopolymer transport system component
VPTVFAPGVISGPQHETAPAFSPDGATVWFSRSDGTASTVLVSHRAGDRWSTPEVAPFSGHWNDMEPAMAPDGSHLVFVSNRPARDGGRALDGVFNGRTVTGGGGNLWRIDRTPDGWSAPQRLPDLVNASASTFAPSIARDGSLWFMRPDATTGRFRLFRAAREADHYAAPVALPFSDGTSTDVDPAVAPDESFVVFGSGRAPARGIDLFIARRTNGTWSAPVSLGDTVNSAGSDAEPRLGPDGTTLYFSSERRSAAPADANAEWNNGKYNLWVVDLRPWVAK